MITLPLAILLDLFLYQARIYGCNLLRTVLFLPYMRSGAGYRRAAGLRVIPHGLSVIVTAPATFRWTSPADPERHLRAAQLLGAQVSGLNEAQRREILPQTLLTLMRDTGSPATWERSAIQVKRCQPWCRYRDWARHCSGDGA